MTIEEKIEQKLNELNFMKDSIKLQENEKIGDLYYKILDINFNDFDDTNIIVKCELVVEPINDSLEYPNMTPVNIPFMVEVVYDKENDEIIEINKL